MVQSDTEIGNLALSHLAVGKDVSNMWTEKSPEARALSRFYPLARDAVLSDFAWPFASRYATLGLVASQPNTEWAYAYRYPADAVSIQRILLGIPGVTGYAAEVSRLELPEMRVPFQTSSDANGRLILTDQASAVAKYTTRISDVTQFTSSFTLALSLRLAAYIAPRVTAGDPFKLGARAMQLYQQELSQARVNAVQETQADPLSDSELIRSRL